MKKYICIVLTVIMILCVSAHAASDTAALTETDTNTAAAAETEEKTTEAASGSAKILNSAAGVTLPKP